MDLSVPRRARLSMPACLHACMHDMTTKDPPAPREMGRSFPSSVCFGDGGVVRWLGARKGGVGLHPWRAVGLVEAAFPAVHAPRQAFGREQIVCKSSSPIAACVRSPTFVGCVFCAKTSTPACTPDLSHRHGSASVVGFAALVSWPTQPAKRGGLHFVVSKRA